MVRQRRARSRAMEMTGVARPAWLRIPRGVHAPQVCLDELDVTRRVLGLARRERGGAALVIALGLASALLEGLGLSLLIPLASLLSGGDGSGGPAAFAWLARSGILSPLGLAWLAIGLFLLGVATAYVNLVVSNVVAMRFADEMRRRVFELALRRRVAEIEGLPPGKFVNTLAAETWRVCDALFTVLGALVNIIAAMAFLCFLMILSPAYSFVLIATSAATACVVHLTTRAVRTLGEAAVGANETFMAHVWDALAGLRVVRGFGREEHERARFAVRSREVRETFRRLKLLSGAVGPIARGMTILMVAALVGLALARGDDVATLAGFLAIAWRMQPRIVGLMKARTGLRALDPSVREVEAALAGTARAVPAQRPNFEGLSDGVRFERVSARYPGSDRPALRDVSCDFRRGAMTAVAGRSGAGKSTLVAVLLGFLEPCGGRVMLDGAPLETVDRTAWARRVAFVDQGAFLFNASVRENVAYGDLDADESAIRAALRGAQAESFVDELPGGLDAVIGDRGCRLSHGQRQRIALARALLRAPDVLILDEATSALDAPTESALRDAVDAARRRCALIVIAHRRATIEAADAVVVLEEGRVVESGTPAALSRRGSTFAALYPDPPLFREA